MSEVKITDCYKCEHCKWIDEEFIMGYYCNLADHFLGIENECPKAGEHHE